MRLIPLVVVLLLLPALAFSQGDGKMVAIQAKKYNMKHEFTLGPGFLPLSAYYKGLTANATYTYHFSDFYAWRIANINYVYNISTGLRDSLEKIFNATPSAFSKIQFFFSTDFVVTPFYRKMILFNRFVLHGETFFLIGAGAFKFEGQQNAIGAAPENGKLKPSLDIGVGFRIWMNQWLSTRVDVTHFMYWVKGFDFDHVLFLGLSVAVNFPIKSREK